MFIFKGQDDYERFSMYRRSIMCSCLPYNYNYNIML